jgi:hypothetical protein
MRTEPSAPDPSQTAEERLAELRRRRREAADVLAETLLNLWLKERRAAQEKVPDAE